VLLSFKPLLVPYLNIEVNSLFRVHDEKLSVHHGSACYWVGGWSCFDSLLQRATEVMVAPECAVAKGAR
jgi:hypothetical protein